MVGENSVEMAGAEENKMVNQTAGKRKDNLKINYKHLNFLKIKITNFLK